MILSIFLVIFGSAATISAFGGEGWAKGDEPLIRRVTLRGWISISCLFIALILGIIKEVNSASSELELKSQRDKASQELKAANEKLITITDSLAKTREQLDKQQNINLITALAKSDTIRDASWWIKMSPEASKANNVIEYLVSKLPSEFKQVIVVDLNFRPYVGLNAFVQYRAGENGVVASYPYLNESLKPEIILPSFLTTEDMWLVDEEELGSKKTNYIFTQKLRQEEDNNPAVAYRDFTRNNIIGSLALSFKRRFKSEEERDEFIKANNHLKAIRGWHHLSDGEYSVEFQIPDNVKLSVRRYWKETINKSDAHIYLDGKSHLMISSDIE